MIRSRLKCLEGQNAGGVVEYFLVRLAYTPAAWSEMNENTTSLDRRLAPVRKRTRHFGGSLASFGFFDTEHSRNAAVPSHVVTDEFVMWSGHDPLTIVAIGDREAVHALNMAVSTEAGLKTVDLTPIVPMQDAVKAMVAAKVAIAQAGHAAPGRVRP